MALKKIKNKVVIDSQSCFTEEDVMIQVGALVGLVRNQDPCQVDYYNVQVAMDMINDLLPNPDQMKVV